MQYSATFTIILPLTDNEGNDLSKEVETIEREIAEYTGGITVQPVFGVWYDKGVRYEDNSVRVTTAVIDEHVYNVEYKISDLLSRVKRWGKDLRQLAIYTEVMWSEVDIMDTSVQDAA